MTEFEMVRQQRFQLGQQVESLRSILRKAIEETERTIACVGGPYESSNMPTWVAEAKKALEPGG